MRVLVEDDKGVWWLFEGAEACDWNFIGENAHPDYRKRVVGSAEFTVPYLEQNSYSGAMKGRRVKVSVE